MAWKLSAVVEHGPDVLEGVVDDEIVVYSVASGDSVGLSGTSAWIWRAIGDGSTVRDLVRRACEEFDVPRSVCTPDIVGALESLRSRGMLRVAG